MKYTQENTSPHTNVLTAKQRNKRINSKNYRAVYTHMHTLTRTHTHLRTLTHAHTRTYSNVVRARVVDSPHKQIYARAHELTETTQVSLQTVNYR